MLNRNLSRCRLCVQYNQSGGREPWLITALNRPNEESGSPLLLTLQIIGLYTVALFITLLVSKSPDKCPVTQYSHGPVPKSIKISKGNLACFHL